MPNNKLYFVEAVLFDGDRSLRIVTADENNAILKLRLAFQDRYGDIQDYGYDCWEEWEEDNYVHVQEIRLDKYWEEY